MRKIYYHLIPFFIIINFSAHAQWVSLGHGLPETNKKIWCLHVVNEDLIWGTAWDHVTFEFPEYIIKSTDGGATWTSSPINIPGDLYTFQVFALDSLTAWIATADELNPISGKVFKTTDGGITWIEQTSGFTGFNQTPGSLHFWNANEGVAFGATCYDDYNDQIAIYWTDDGGDSWNGVVNDSMPTQLPGEGMCLYAGEGYYDVIGDTIWWVTSKNRILKSLDKGRSWEAISVTVVGANENVASLAFRDGHNGLLSTITPNRLYQTNDGGLNWIQINTPFTSPITQIEYVPQSIGTYLVHDGSPNANSANMAITYDEGENWNAFFSDANLYGMEFLSPNIGFGAGKIIDSDQGGVYRWEGFTSSVKETLIKKIKISPNPATNFVKIKLPNGGQGFLEIQILDIKGNLIRQETLNSANGQVSLEGLTSGIYLLRVMNNKVFLHWSSC